ncbi:recombinase family protein [Rhodococcus koreensis]
MWTDIAPGSKEDGPELAAVIDHLRPGDTPAVWRVGRLARSLPHPFEIVTRLEAGDIGFKSLTEEIDTNKTRSGGEDGRRPKPLDVGRPIPAR